MFQVTVEIMAYQDLSKFEARWLEPPDDTEEEIELERFIEEYTDSLYEELLDTAEKEGREITTEDERHFLSKWAREAEELFQQRLQLEKSFLLGA